METPNNNNPIFKSNLSQIKSNKSVEFIENAKSLTFDNKSFMNSSFVSSGSSSVVTMVPLVSSLQDKLSEYKGLLRNKEEELVRTKDSLTQFTQKLKRLLNKYNGNTAAASNDDNNIDLLNATEMLLTQLGEKFVEEQNKAEKLKEEQDLLMQQLTTARRKHEQESQSLDDERQQFLQLQQSLEENHLNAGQELESRYESLREQVQELNKREKGIQDLVLKLKKQEQILHEKHERFDAQAKKLEEENLSLKSRDSELKDKVSKLEKDTERLERKQVEFQELCSKKLQELKLREQSVKACESSQQRKQIESVQLKKEVDAARQELNHIQENTKSARLQIKAKLMQAELDLSNSKETKRLLDEDILSLQSRKEGLLLEIEGMSTKRDDIVKQLDNEHAKLDKIHQQKYSDEKSLAITREEWEKVKLQKNKLTQEVDLLEKRHIALSNSILENDSQQLQLQKSLAALQKKLTVTSNKYNASMAKIESLQNETAQLTKTISNQKKYREKIKSEVQRSMQKAQLFHDQSLNDINLQRKELDQQLLNLDSKAKQISIERKELNDERSAFNGEKIQYSNASNEIERDRQILSKDREHLDAELTELRGQLADKDNQLLVIKEQMKTITSKYVEAEQTKRQIDQMVGNVEMQAKRLELKEKEMLQKIKLTANAEQDLKSNIRSLKERETLLKATEVDLIEKEKILIKKARETEHFLEQKSRTFEVYIKRHSQKILQSTIRSINRRRKEQAVRELFQRWWQNSVRLKAEEDALAVLSHERIQHDKSSTVAQREEAIQKAENNLRAAQSELAENLMFMKRTQEELDKEWEKLERATMEISKRDEMISGMEAEWGKIEDVAKALHERERELSNMESEFGSLEENLENIKQREEKVELLEIKCNENQQRLLRQAQSVEKSKTLIEKRLQELEDAKSKCVDQLKNFDKNKCEATKTHIQTKVTLEKQKEDIEEKLQSLHIQEEEIHEKMKALEEFETFLIDKESCINDREVSIRKREHELMDNHLEVERNKCLLETRSKELDELASLLKHSDGGEHTSSSNIVSTSTETVDHWSTSPYSIADTQ